MLAVAGDLKPSIGRTRRLMRRWSCSILLFKYRLFLIVIGFSQRRERSSNRFAASQEVMASRLVWLPSMTMGSGR